MTLGLVLAVWAIFWPHSGGAPSRAQYAGVIQQANPATMTPPAPARVQSKKRALRTPVLSATGPTKTVVRNGGAYDLSVEFAPTIPKEQADQETDNANQLLATAEENLKTLTQRPLNDSQQETLSHIKNYMSRASAALDSGDVERGHKLAVKANVLAHYMVRHPSE
jgi:hypothetical protein